MIANLIGTILRHDDNSIVLDVKGVGYRIFMTAVGLTTANSTSKSQDISLFIHHVIRENSMDLYGFFDEQEQYFFELLLSVSGIGPKSALSILNIADVSTLREAIAENDSSYLTKVSGIGTKSAQKIVLELHGKLDSMPGESTEASRSGDIDTIDALVALGYSQGEVRAALKEIPKDIEDASEKIKQVLKLLGK